MKLRLHVFSLLSMFAITSSLAISMSKPSCQEKCGNVSIPYPFGIGSNCSANSSMRVVCENSTTPFLFLSSIYMEVLNLCVYGTVVVKQPVSPVSCSVEQTTGGSLPNSFKGSPFKISARYNSLAVLGCKNSVWLRANKTTTIGGCTAMCDANSTDTTCNGVNCCQTTIPTTLQELHYTYQSNQAGNHGFCGYVFPVDKRWFLTDYTNYKGLARNMSNLDLRHWCLSGNLVELKLTNIAIIRTNLINQIIIIIIWIMNMSLQPNIAVAAMSTKEIHIYLKDAVI